MRSLLPVPDAALDPVTFAPRVGSYRGGLARVDLSALHGGALRRIAREKRWLYVSIVTGDLYLAVAVVRLGYVANAFAFAFDKRSMRMSVDHSALGPPFACDVGDTASEGCVAMFRLGRKTSILVRRAHASTAYAVEVRVPELEIHATIESATAPPAITAVARLDGDSQRVNTTEKRALLDVRGHAVIRGERRSLDGALAGYDYTHGLPARHTTWRWAWLLGHAKSGERVAMNLVEGFVGEAECAVWIDGEVFPLAEGRFEFDAKNPLATWRVRTADGGVDLRFSPGGMHSDRTNLGVVASRFVQPAGVFAGTIRVEGRAPIELDGVLGVTEDQDVLW
jgi:hypothetical protein